MRFFSPLSQKRELAASAASTRHIKDSSPLGEKLANSTYPSFATIIIALTMNGANGTVTLNSSQRINFSTY